MTPTTRTLSLAVLLAFSASHALASSYSMRVPVKGLVTTTAQQPAPTPTPEPEKPEEPAPASCDSTPRVFTYTGASVPVFVPEACTTATVQMWGAGGAAGNKAYAGGHSQAYAIGGQGGGGGYVGFTLTGLLAEQMMLIQVGQGGLAPTYVDAPNYPGYAGGGTGGGRSQLMVNGTLIAVAGAGGGGGGGGDAVSQGALGGDGGAGGTAAGNAAGNGKPGVNRTGGISGANGGSGGYSGASYVGGSECLSTPHPIFPNGGTYCNSIAGNIASSNLPGMGGDGFFGGGSGERGYSPYATQGGGGGGSSYVLNAAQVTSAQVQGGAGTTPGNAADAARGGAGEGGAKPTSVIGNNGAPGRVVIVFSK